MRKASNYYDDIHTRDDASRKAREAVMAGEVHPTHEGVYADAIFEAACLIRSHEIEPAA
jgi:hypothetical protein